MVASYSFLEVSDDGDCSAYCDPDREAPPGFINDQLSQGWGLLEEGPLVEGEPVLNFLSFLREGELHVNGEVMLARAKAMEGRETSQHHLMCMLRQAASLPEELRPFRLVATATKWRYPSGYVCVPCLRWYNDQWILRFCRVDEDSWIGYDRVVRVCQ